MNRNAFIAAIAPMAVDNYLESGVLPSITIAQGALESAWGRSAPGNNLFGIKGTGQEQTTTEYVNGHYITIVAGFRTYDSWEGSVLDHSQFLRENRRYTNAGFFIASDKLDYAEAARALQRAGYATDPNYATKLISIIEANQLMNYDEEGRKAMSRLTELEELVRQYESRIAALERRINISGKEIIPPLYYPAINAAKASGVITTSADKSKMELNVIQMLYNAGLTNKDLIAWFKQFGQTGSETK